ncbi:unnamed protein product [Adineta ricciae]|uniref:G-protein coupled receptors family 1 profile domain-containing protein n=1 Tax=Adineta ricciae TaxID=249248 RepID=A0A815MJ44_ADIRI|nr:unnamed protein product [Adineta ricciae]CAF1420219.1 unnamed protein product [Adineta ricciae]
MPSTTYSLASNLFSIYAGLPIFCLGTIGNLINLGVLFSARSIPCSFFLLISSFFNIITLSTGLLPRVLSIGFNIDASSTNIVWCKSRLFFSYIGSLTSITCICLASIDRYLMSCRAATRRNRSTLRASKIAVMVAVLMIIGMNIPYLVYFTIVETKTAAGSITKQCSLANSNIVQYGNYVLRPVFLSILPGTILISTGFFTYRNLTSITGVRLRGTFQRNLTSMILLQIFVVVIPIIPFATMNIYLAITSSMVKTSIQVAQETLASDIGNIILYVSYASNFYVYLISASSYRKNFVQLIMLHQVPKQWNNHIGIMTRE